MLDNIPSVRKRLTSDVRSIRKNRQILDGAREIFLLNGYAEATMEEIAAKAGVSKGTLYNHFASKDDMFKSLIHAEAERLARDLPSPDPDDPNPASALRQIGIAMLKMMEAPETVATLRLVIGSLGRFPRLGEEFLTKSLSPTVEQIALYLETHGADENFQIQDKHAAADRFTKGCLAHVMERVLLPAQRDQLGQMEAECSAWVEQVLRALGTSTRTHYHG
jgi:TetR/AcrR family transcriptional repressor of mexJK operon